MKSLDPSSALSVLLTADDSALRRVRDAVDALIDARQKITLPRNDERAVSVAAPPPVRAVAPPVAPKRPPRPGSLRGDVHAVLARHGQMTRAAIIHEVGLLRGEHKHLATKVGDVLHAATDPSIEKVSRGVFRYVQR